MSDVAFRLVMMAFAVAYITCVLYSFRTGYIKGQRDILRIVRDYVQRRDDVNQDAAVATQDDSGETPHGR